MSQEAHSSRLSPCRLVCALAGTILLVLLCTSASASSLPSGFEDRVVVSGLENPTAVRFAPDGRVFVAEKSGIVKVLDGIADTTPTVFADLRTNVHDFWDRGLLGLALDPGFPQRPYVYVLYTYDFDPETPWLQAPRWGDTCPDPPGALDDGCVANGRLSRLEISPSNTQVGAEQVLLENNWCIQYVTHSVGDLMFDSEGALLVSAGEGANLEVDYGQYGGTNGVVPRNPCGDPPGGVGGPMSLPSAEGGGLRAQDLRTPGDPLSFDGSILRIHPDTGAAWPDNPLVGGNPADDRTIAFGLRNPFRFTLRPGTEELWIGDVGWDDWEEIDRLPSLHGPVANFGWPCYEGSAPQPAYAARHLSLCESLYDAPGSAQAPFFAYRHQVAVDPAGDGCDLGSSAISGLAFYAGGAYPPSYAGALFFADYGRNCIYVVPQGSGGAPDPALRSAFAVGTDGPVDLEPGPGGDLYYVSLLQGQIHRISYSAGNTPPSAIAHASTQGGPLPLTVHFDASASSDPDPGAVLSYAWDLDGDGQFDDSNQVSPDFTYTAPGTVQVRLRVADEHALSDTALLTLQPGDTLPVATITSPATSSTFKVGDVLTFSGQGSDAEDGSVPAARMHWDVILHHCPNGTTQCHVHVIEHIDGVDHGTLTAPDHDWSAFLELRLRVTDAAGMSSETSVELQPQSVVYSYDSVPSGLSLIVGSMQATTPFSRPAIVGSSIGLSAPTPQSHAGEDWRWQSWSNGGAQSQSLVADESPETLVATFVTEKILVVFAHPDDDAISASGIIARAHQDGVPVKIVYLTNGDLVGGVSTGTQREGEAVAAQALLGTPESDLIFFGYPDGSLSTLRSSYPNSGDQFTTSFGQSVTYASRGLGATDYHSHRFGSPAAYNGYNLTADLTDLLASYQPTHIVVTSEWDQHADHRAAYMVVVDALGNLFSFDPSYMPSVHKTIIWADPPNDPPVWPAPTDAAAYFTEPPHLASTNLLWSARESFDVPLPLQSTDNAQNPKYQSIDQHQTQGGAQLFLGRFVHKDEFFWVENVLSPNQPPRVEAGQDILAGHGAQVQLDGSASHDPENVPLTYSWRQTSGPAVTLSDATIASPTFLTPVSGQALILTFELTVSDGQFVSLPDAVTVRVLGAANIAPLSSVLASSETTDSGQLAIKAVDGVISGYPADHTREWATNGQGVGAWIQLNWSRPYCIDRVVLYDRPNQNDQILAGTLFCSDATTIPVGALDNAAGATEVSFPRRVVNSVRLTVDQVSPTTENVGLAEFEVYRCVQADFDADDWTAVEGDCNDSDPLANPARPELAYNGKDDDCNPATPDDDLDHDGYPVASDCSDLDPGVNPGASEIPYNGKDDDCDPASPDDDLDQDGYGHQADCNDQDPGTHRIPVEVAALRVTLGSGTTHIDWSPQDALAGPAINYDVVRGSLGELRADHDFDRALCLTATSAPTATDPAPNPAAGEAIYYLVRAYNGCGNGSYGDSSLTPDPRNALDAMSPCAVQRIVVPRGRRLRVNAGSQ